MGSNNSTALIASLAATLDELAQVPVGSLADEALRDELLALARINRQVQAQLAGRVAGFDAHNLAVADGCRTVSTFAAAFARQPASTTKPLLVIGRVLRDLPLVAAAAHQGHISTERLRALGELVKDITPAKAAYLDAWLADVLAAGSDRDVTAGFARVRAHLNPDGKPPGEQYERRHLSLYPRNGLVRISGELDPEAGAALHTVLDALVRPPTPADQRTHPQRMADALGDLALRALNRGDLPSVNGERPHLGILVTPAALTATPAPAKTLAERTAAFLDWLQHHQPDHGACPTCSTLPPDPGDDEQAWLAWVGAVPAQLAQRVACDSILWRTILDPTTGLPLDVGRDHRTAPRWLRRALHTRDRGCRFPGCDVPAEWTDAHHLICWRDGGHTKLECMVLLCRFHHRLMHEYGWTITLDQHTGVVHVFRPGGAPYELGPSQPHTGATTTRAP